jgi:predicted ATPase/DNA-binding winged helix-turn-helix (wHTH) protein
MSTGSDESSALMGDDIIAFGPFQLNRRRCELLKHGVPVPMGSRAIAILLELTRSAGEIVSHRDLLRRVWHSTVVEDGTVRVHVAQLRKILRHADPGGEYVQNVTGRGYRFVMPVSSRGRSGAAKIAEAASVRKLPLRQPLRRNNVPQRMTSIIGREQIIRALAGKVTTQRFVTITGAGGSGKTTVAIGVADALTEAYPDGVCFVDLAAISETRPVANALASALGVAPLAADPLPEVLATLSQQSLLLILDSCEHMIEATAKLAERVLRSAPRVHILATSREPVRAAGESVHDLSPLDVPPEQSPHTRARLLECPAIQLFLERAKAYADAEFDDEDLRRIAGICRRLGGNPLAIEITAGHVRLLGVKTLAASLDDELYLSIDGRRTADPRHQSLRAMFDWSYALLSPAEQATFRRLSVFAGCFDLDCAVAVVADESITEIGVFESLMSLARKSLVCADTRGEVVSYRLLDLPRAYAREKLVEAAEQGLVRHRHAQMWCSVGAMQIQAHVRQGSTEWVSVFGPRIEDLRAATRWSFSASSGSSLTTKLKLTSLWFEFVLSAESSGEPAWVELYANIVRGSEGALLSGLEGLLESSRRWNESSVHELTVLQQIESESENKTALWSLWFERVIKRDYRIAINLSNAARAHSRTSSHKTALKDRLLAVAHHYAGEQVLACEHAQRALDTNEAGSTTASQEALLRCHTRSILARALWLRGFADQALETSLLGVSEAERAGVPRMRCMTLLVAIAVAIWCGNTVVAKQCLDRMHEQATAHSLEYHQLWADCLRMIVGAPACLHVIEPLQLCDDPLSGSQYLDILGSLREELVSTDAMVRAEAGRNGWCTSEILRVKAERLIQGSDAGALSCAEVILHRALETARLQGARSWELRTAMSLARLWSGQGRMSRARGLLTAVYSRFTEGFDTADLTAARRLLQQLDANIS